MVRILTLSWFHFSMQALFFFFFYWLKNYLVTFNSWKWHHVCKCTSNVGISTFFHRQLGHRSGNTSTSLSSPSPSPSSSSRLVPLVQGLSHQVHLFLVEYNKCSRLRLDLPGYRSPLGGPGDVDRDGRQDQQQQVPEEILHQQRALLQCCDRLKLAASLHQVIAILLSSFSALPFSCPFFAALPILLSE